MAESKAKGSSTAVETHFVTSRWPDDAHARVPATAASDTARPWRPDGCSHTCRLRAPIQVRYKTHKALEHSRYMRLTLLVNPDTRQVETVKVDDMSCALRLTDALYPTFTGGGVERHRDFAVRPACLSGDPAPSRLYCPTTQTCHPFCLTGQGVRIPPWGCAAVPG